MHPNAKLEPRQVIVATLAAITLMLVSVGALVGYAVRVIDTTAEIQETHVVQRTLTALSRRLEREATTATEWDAAFTAVAERNLAWLTRYYGAYYAGSFDHDVTIVFDAQGAPLFGYADGKPMADGQIAQFATSLLPAVRAVQTGELARRRTLNRKDANDSSLASRASAAVVGSETYVMGLASVLPSTYYVEGVAPAAVVATGRRVDRRFVLELEKTLALKGLRLSSRVPSEAATGRVGLKDFRGREIATLAWTPNHPAAEAARRFAKPASLIVLALLASCLIIGVLVRHLLVAVAARDASLSASMEELSRARDAAQAASAFKSRFIVNVSHEIRTPLNGVLGMADVMEMGALDASQRERLALIQRSGRGLVELLDDVIDLARMETQNFEIGQAAFDLEDLITDVMSTFEALAETKGIAFRLEVSTAAAGTYVSDAARIRQILHNLLGNALKFIDAGSVTLAAAYSNRTLTLTVQDTGPGIPADELPRLLQKYEQADGSMTRRHGGVGLGLPMSVALAEALGGRLDAESRVGAGSSFRLSLPLQRMAATALERARERGPAAFEAPDLRVLVVEDNYVNQLVATTLLDHWGIEPDLVEDGALAVSARRNGTYDLILMDIHMPGMDGIEATRRIRALEASEGLPRTPIVALTANVIQQDAYTEAGMDGCLAKPIDTALLLGVLQGVAEQRRAQT